MLSYVLYVLKAKVNLPVTDWQNHQLEGDLLMLETGRESRQQRATNTGLVCTTGKA